MKQQNENEESNAASVSVQSDRTFLATEPIGKLLVKLALPTIAAQLINMLYNIVDRIYIGHIPDTGAMALTGVGVCMPLIMIITAFAALVGNGGAPRATIFMGKNKKDDAEKILANCFTMQILLSIILTVVLLIWNRDFLLAFGASANTIEYASSYMNIYALGTIFVQLTLGMNAFITAQGFAKEGMLSVLIGAIANIILDPIFIFGLHMGVRGAALATVISQCCSCIWVISFLFGKRTTLRIRGKNMGLKAAYILPCLALGSAIFIMQGSESIISVCFNSSLLKYGGDIAVGAMTILTSVMQFAMLPLQGLGQGAQPIISYNYGAKNASRVRAAFKLLLKVSLLYSTILWLFIMCFPKVFASIFTTDAAVVQNGYDYLKGFALETIVTAILFSIIGYFNGHDKTVWVMVQGLVQTLLVRLPLAYYMSIQPDASLTKIGFAAPAATIFGIVLNVIYYLYANRKQQ